MHTLLAAPDTTESMCKTMLSAEVLKYACVNLPNTKAGGDNPTHLLGGHRKNKLMGITDYLKSDVRTFKPGDMAMVIDGHNVLFHLPPKALFSRYRDIIESSNDRLRSRVGPAPVDSGVVENSIVISSPACSGPDGGAQTATAQDPLIPGVIMGPIEQMRRVFEKLNNDRANNQEGNLKYTCVFHDLLTAQEAHRESMSWWLYSLGPRIALWFSHTFGGEPEPSDLPGNDAEYGLTLDTNSLIIATPESLERKRCEDLGGLQTAIYGSYSSRCAFLNDIRPPFWTQHGTVPQNDTTWFNRDLPYSLAAKTFPVMTQNSMSAGLEENTKIAGQDQWENMWFHPHARALLDTHVWDATLPIAKVDTRKGEWTYWPRWAERGGARSADGQWQVWDKFCGGDLGEKLFRDGKGSWQDPRGGWTGGG